jgi:hypothetical protein
MQTRNPLRRASWIAALPALCLFASPELTAKPLAMRLSGDLKNVEAMPVRGRKPGQWQAGFQFASWESAPPASFDAGSWSWDAPMGESRSNEEVRLDVDRVGFEFELRPAANAAPAMGQCLAQGRFAVHTEYRGNTTDETTMTLPGYPRVDCKLSGAQRGYLSLRPAFVSQRDSGLLQVGEKLWNVQSVNNLASQRSNFPLARFGYEFSTGGEVVAAVETAGSGRVWFQPGLSEEDREDLAAAMTALLYYGAFLDTQVD